MVLVHGLSIPAITWSHIGPYLAERGFRVLVYGELWQAIYDIAIIGLLKTLFPDLYGKGYSEAPQIKYTPALFVTQLALLMQYIRWDSAHIVGFSMVRDVSSPDRCSNIHLSPSGWRDRDRDHGFTSSSCDRQGCVDSSCWTS